MPGCVLTALGGFALVVDRVEGDRVVVEWCDRTTSDVPAALLPAGLAEGAELTVFLVAPSATTPLPGPVPGVAGPQFAGRAARAASEPSGAPRTEIRP